MRSGRHSTTPFKRMSWSSIRLDRVTYTLRIVYLSCIVDRSCYIRHV